MKKFIVILILAIFSIASYSQKVSLWKPLPKDLFSSTLYKTGGTQVWFWRFDATIVADELVYNKTIKQFSSVALSAVGPAIGYKHFVPTSTSDPTPYCNFGVSASLLLGTDIYQASLASMKFALFANVFQFLKVGGAYTLNTPADIGHFSILLGGSINF